MYQLFEFVRLLSVRSNRQNKPSHGKVNIMRIAWKEEGEISFLALLCSNDHLLLRYDLSGHSPIIKQLPWLPEKSIGSMCFDQTLTWLLIVTEVSQEIFIVPALSIIDSEAVVNQIFKTDDITKLTFKITSGTVSCGIWWQTLEGKQVAVIGTTVGEILFIDLLNEGSCTKVTIDVTITDLSLSQDDLQMNTTLLITTITGNQWKLLLETRSTTVSFSPDSDIKDMGYDSIDGRNVPPLTILDSAVENSFLFTPSQFVSFQPPTYLRPQYARGRHFITAHCTLSSTLQVLDSVSQINPLFVYKLPVGAQNTILTDKLIFTVINHSRDRKLMILSNQKSENSLDEHQEFNMDAVIQEFDLAEGENLFGVERKRYPFYYHEHNENEWAKRTRTGSVVQQIRSHDVHLDNAVLNLPVTTHTVLDGCIIVTNCSVYEIRPRISPERLFLHLAMTLPETTEAENLAISIGLDLTSLSELAAECMLKKSYFGRAMKLYTLSKCPAAKRTGGLARHGCISETLIHLRNVLSSPTFELNTWERKFLSSMLLHCFVYQLHSPGQAMANTQIGLSDFLFGSFSFDEQTALNLLADFGEVELLLSLAKARGLVVDALTTLVKSEAFPAISFSALSDLVQRGFCAHLLQSGSGCLLPCLSPEDLVRLLTTRPQLAIQNFSLLKPIVPILKLSHLLELARIFDPSKSVMRGTLLRLQTMRRRTNSLTSLGSIASDSMENQLDPRELQAEFLIEFFLLVILHINAQRRQLTNHWVPSFDKIVTSPADDLEELDKAQNSHDTHKKLLVQVQPVACGPKHSAAVRNCDLYTWGRSAQGRLGHGDLSQQSCPPMRVETLHILKLRVDAVACGCEHTLALTQQGVYGWGNSKYGQVGVGTCHIYKRPMLLETFLSETVVAVDCGHYHSLALTADHQVYTWGWGVHGQLGHGNPEDCMIPTHVAYLLSLGVVKVAGGYAHSIVLTEEGDVLTFGSGYFGQLGVGLNNKTSLPLKVVLPTPAVIIATKFFHCVAVTASNKVYTWGLHPQNLRQIASSMRSSRLNGQSQEQASFLSPILVETTYVHGKITRVCCGSLHSALLTDDGGVYVWGRNLEGQLGTGSRQDERMPKMLTSINDQQIVNIASGGEFNLAIDIEGSIWAWGKNDSGQLGYIKSRRDGQGAKPIALNTFRRSVSNHGSEANTPSPVRGLPVSDVNNPQWMALLSTLNQDILWSEPSKTESEDSLDSLPSLDHLGDEMYDSCVVPVTLKVLENVCESTFCLQNSVDLGDWITAGHINCLEGDFVQALFYRLKAVTSSIAEMDRNDIIKLCAQLVKYHIHLVSGKVPVDFTMEKVLIQMCSYALQFWQSNRFPISQLEAIFLEYLPQLAAWLVEVVLKHSAKPSPDHTDFTTHFSLQVLKCHMALVTAESGGGKDGQEWQRLIAEASVEPSLLQARVHLQQRDKLTPRDHLLADILRNMKKETGVISLTNTQLNHLDETEQPTDDETTAASLNSVVFTCGHHYSEKTFKLEAVPRLISELTNARTRLQNSASLMKQLLSQSVIRPSACPRCILNSLRVN